MTEGDATVRMAVDLLQMPSRVPFLRTQPLPPGLPHLLRVAAGDERAAESSARALKRSKTLIFDACRFYIDQVLLAPESDNYRVLGASSLATNGELRRNMALLLRGLHPDLNSEGRTASTQRITAAWEQLKTTERRAAYDHRPRQDVSPQPKAHWQPRKVRLRRPTLRQRLASFLGRTK